MTWINCVYPLLFHTESGWMTSTLTGMKSQSSVTILTRTFTVNNWYKSTVAALWVDTNLTGCSTSSTSVDINLQLHTQKSQGHFLNREKEKWHFTQRESNSICWHRSEEWRASWHKSKVVSCTDFGAPESVMFPMKAMRYYRLWIYTCNAGKKRVFCLNLFLEQEDSTNSMLSPVTRQFPPERVPLSSKRE